MNPIIVFIVDLLTLIIGVAAGYFYHRYQADRATKAKQEKSEDILKAATSQARLIESGSRDSATKIVQAAESEMKERRIELNRETERLDKRRGELDARFDKIEQREATLNKRQSQVDKRANDIDKLYEDQFKKLEQVAQMTTEDARKDLFASVEKETALLGEFDICAKFCGKDARQFGNFHSMCELILSVGCAEFQTSHHAQYFDVQACDIGFISGLLTSFVDDLLNGFGFIFDDLFNVCGMNAPIEN